MRFKAIVSFVDTMQRAPDMDAVPTQNGLRETQGGSAMREKRTMTKNGVTIIEKRGLYYVTDGRGRAMRFTPWLGDSLAFLYDFTMKRSIIPKKLDASMDRHIEILCGELRDTHGVPVLELASGSGSAAAFLPSDNEYTGTDISPGLLRRAVKSVTRAGFSSPEFYVSTAEDLPFENDSFAVCLCILSLNFFNDARRVLEEVKRVLVPGGVFVCCVPVPERNERHSTIRGTLRSEEELAGLCMKYDFDYQRISVENGALLYFRATLRQHRVIRPGGAKGPR